MRDRYYSTGTGTKTVLRCRFCGFRLHAAPDQPRCEPGVTCPAERGPLPSVIDPDRAIPAAAMRRDVAILRYAVAVAVLIVLVAGVLAGCTRDSYRSDPTWAGVKQVENP